MDKISAIARYHDQPPYNTPAKQTQRAKMFYCDTPVSEILTWAEEVGKKEGLGQLNRIEVHR